MHFSIDAESRLIEVVEYEIIPQLYEYWFDDEDKAESWANKLRNAYDGKNSKIPIRNIYYMLSYAYQTIGLSEYQRMNVEQFDNVKGLYIEILKIGLPVLIRGGLIKDYVQETDRTTVIKGKIDIGSSIKQNALVDKKLVVLYDVFSEDVLLNQIFKGNNSISL